MKYKYNGQVYDLSIKALDSMPIGSIISFAGENIPTGWLVCDGDVVSSTDYPDLFAEIGNKYGGTSPSFKLPDLRGRVPVGLDPTDHLEEFDTLGNSGGERTHTLTVNEMPSHRHTTNGNLWIQADGYGHINASASTGANRANVIAGRTELEGGGEAHNILQPYLVVNFIIKAKNTTPTMASIVDDYSTSTQDGYSCNYVNKDNTYSTTEIKTNKVWIDGKPIYRLVLTGSGSSYQFNPSTPSEIDALTHCEVYVGDSTSTMSVPLVSVSYSTGNHFIGWTYYNNNASWNANHLYIVKEQGQFSDIQNYYAILEYTKTTD